MRCLWTKKVATTVEMSRSQTRSSSTWCSRGGGGVEVEGRRGGGEAEEGMRKVEVEKREKERGRLNAVPIEEKSSEMRFALVFERCRLF